MLFSRKVYDEFATLYQVFIPYRQEAAWFQLLLLTSANVFFVIVRKGLFKL